MTHHERIRAALAGEPTDRAPFGFWWHFPNRDRSPRRLAELAVALQKRLDLDFIKFSPYGLYSVVDWGVTLEIFAGDSRPPVQEHYPIQSAEDWTRLQPRSGTDGEYLVLLEAQRIALDMLDGQVPFTQTIFSPLTSAAKMVGRDALVTHIRNHPDELHEGLKIITETTKRFIAEVVGRGADGLFFASQAVDPTYITPQEHEEFAKRYDLQVLEATGGRTWFDIFHLHGHEIAFDQVLDYPVHAFNYPRPGLRSLARRHEEAHAPVPARRHLSGRSGGRRLLRRHHVGGRRRVEAARREGPHRHARRGREPERPRRERRPPAPRDRSDPTLASDVHTADVVVCQVMSARRTWWSARETPPGRSGSTAR